MLVSLKASDKLFQKCENSFEINERETHGIRSLAKESNASYIVDNTLFVIICFHKKSGIQLFAMCYTLHLISMSLFSPHLANVVHVH